MSRDMTCSVCKIEYHTRNYSLPLMCDNCKVVVLTAEKEAKDQCERYKAEVSNTLRLMNIVVNQRDDIADERDKYKLALQQVVEKSKVETWAWVIAEEALGDED